MEFKPLRFDAPVPDYRRQAQDLVDAWRAGDPAVVQFVRHKHPRFLSDTIPWLPKNMPEDQVRSTPFELPDAQLAVARGYDFRDWDRLVEHVEAIRDRHSPVARFESAVECVITGDVPGLQHAIESDPALLHARSRRVTHFDPTVHGATLLHYVAANGVEGYRQKSPANAVEIATTLLRAGADVDALADMYGGRYTTMSMLVSSSPPAAAGVQILLVHALLDFGAAVEGRGSGDCVSPLMTALAFGFADTAGVLVQRGARVDTLPAAAGLGRLEDVRGLLADAPPIDRHRALALAAQHGHVPVTEFLIDAGEDPNRYNPDGNHGHSTPLHQAVWARHLDVVRLLVERGVRLDIPDRIYEGTPLGWAEFGGRTEIAEYLRAHGAE